jgi:hypothetical protein
MPTNNAVNISGSGIVKYDGAGTFGSITTTIHQPVVGAASNGLTTLGAMTNGQLIIGSTGADPVLASISAGTGISVTPGAGTISIAATGSAVTWSVVTGDTSMAVEKGYGSNKAGAVAFTLPAVAAIGDTVAIQGMQGSWNIVQGLGQTIFFGNASTTPGAGGSLASTNAFDAIELVCLVANNNWYVTRSIGNITIV